MKLDKLYPAAIAAAVALALAAPPTHATVLVHGANGAIIKVGPGVFVKGANGAVISIGGAVAPAAPVAPVVAAPVVAAPVAPAVVTPASVAAPAPVAPTVVAQAAPAVAPAAATPAAPVVPSQPIATPPSSPAAPAQLPANGMNGPWQMPTYIAVGVVVAYFTATIYSHMIYCAQREEQWHKDNKVARCYNAERDGLPK